MTRIIQRCFLVLAFTGILLSQAQETTTVSDASDTTLNSSEQTSSSAPESSFTSIGTASYSTVDIVGNVNVFKVEEHSSNHEAAAVASSSNPEIAASDVTETYSQTTVVVSSDKEDVAGTATVSLQFGRHGEGQNESREIYEKSNISYVESKVEKSLTHSEGLLKAALEDVETNDHEASFGKLSNSSDKIADLKSTDGTTNDPSVRNTSENYISSFNYETIGNVTDAPIRMSTVTEAFERDTTIRSAALQSSEANFTENSSNDSGQSPVPSKEDLIYNSSDVDKNLTPAETFTTTLSKVQTVESESVDSAKSATRKRSLNATKSMTGSTTVASSELPSNSMLDTSSHTELSARTDTVRAEENVTESVEVAPKLQTELPPWENKTSDDHSDVASYNKVFSSSRDATAAEVTRSPYIYSNATEGFGISDAHSMREEHVMSEATSISSLHYNRTLPISLAALSSFSEASIHPSESLDTTAQTSSTKYDAPSTSTFRRSPELEVEDYSVPAHYSYISVTSETPVTFDPNGMTHNLPQDPDSITFPPEVFHVHGIPTDDYLPRVESSDSVNQSPSLLPGLVKFTEGTTRAFEALEGKLGEMKGVYSSEREMEVVSPVSHGLLPHDEPDMEEMTSRNIGSSTRQPPEPFFTNGPLGSHTDGTPAITKFILPLDDESEEMLNDSPHFVQIQSKSTAVPVTEVKSDDFVRKDLEMNVNNDISHTTGASSQNTLKATHELDFSIDYQPEQSEIRPVTIASPLKTSESITHPPDSFSVEPQSSPDVTKPGDLGTVMPDILSPIILSNPAPNAANQSVEAASVLLQPDIAPPSNVPLVANQSENNITAISNSTIAGVAVKTSVSVSLPLSKTSNSSINSTVDQIIENANILPNISGVIHPVPIHLSKDDVGHSPPTLVSTESSTISTTPSGALRILKPKLKIGGSSSPETPRTRKPFLAPPQRSSTTAGPPASIFNKSRTRAASITSSTTSRPFPQFSTIRVHYASRIPGMMPDGELVFPIEHVTTPVPTTTETEEPYSDEPFTEQTQGPIFPSEDDVTLIKVAGYIVVEKGLRWHQQLINRHSPEYKKKADYVQMQLNRLFRSSPIASQLWKIQIDGFSGLRKSRSVAIDFFLYLIKSHNEISVEQLTSVFHDKLINNTFSRFTVNPTKTTFEFLNEEPMKPTTEAPEAEQEPVIPQWAIAVIVVGAASLIFIVLFAVVAILGRHHMRRRYSNKLNDEDSDRPSDWESKMAAAYENLAADTIYDAEDLHSDTYKKKYNSTYHGRPSRPQRADSWSSSDWSPPPRRPRPQVHRIVY